VSGFVQTLARHPRPRTPPPLTPRHLDMSSPAGTRRRSITLKLRRPSIGAANMATSTASLPLLPKGLPLHLSSQPHHNRDLTLQKYLLLQEQHDNLRQHLDELRPLHTSIISPTGEQSTRSTIRGSVSATSPTSPTGPPQQPHRRTPSAPQQQRHRRRLSMPFATPAAQLQPAPQNQPGNLEAVPEVATEEARLSDVNEGIKRALTELLNCETVRRDRSFRTWVQSRLMEVERELRGGRRRRHAPDFS
jgi:hypothetical protein